MIAHFNTAVPLNIRLPPSGERPLTFPSSTFWFPLGICTSTLYHQSSTLGLVAKLVSTPCIIERFRMLVTPHSDGYVHSGTIAYHRHEFPFQRASTGISGVFVIIRDGYGKSIGFEIHHIDYSGLTAAWHWILCTIAAFWMGLSGLLGHGHLYNRSGRAFSNGPALQGT